MTTQMKNHDILAYLLIVIFVGCTTLPVLRQAHAANKAAGSQVKSVLVAQAPTIDGLGNDEAWNAAESTKVAVKEISGNHKDQAAVMEIKSVRTATDIYFLLSWDDSSHDATHKSWVWNSEKKAYEQGSDREDVVALSFENTGAFGANMLDGIEAIWDVWHWKAARTDPAGYAMDKTHHYSKTKPLGKAKTFLLPNGGTIWIARPEDKGQSPQKSRPAPEKYQGDRIAKYIPGKPSGSAADIRAKGNWKENRWTVEFARKLATGHTDDTAFDIRRSYRMGIAVFDREEHIDHSTSAVILLSFVSKAPATNDTTGNTSIQSKVDSAPVILESSYSKTQAPWNFDGSNEIPHGWKAAETKGKGKPAIWQVISDDSAPSQPNVIAITASENHGSTFNLVLAEDTKYKDLKIEVMIKAISGKEDQGGGPIWRVKDADNYYIARWNPLEDNFRIYFVKNGRRKKLGSAKVKADPGVWHKIGIEHKGNKIVAKFDSSKLIELKDSTFSEPGMVGLWTKADAATAFDDFEVEEKDSD